jgi:hypothetical protein
MRVFAYGQSMFGAFDSSRMTFVILDVVQDRSAEHGVSGVSIDILDFGTSHSLRESLPSQYGKGLFLVLLHYSRKVHCPSLL